MSKKERIESLEVDSQGLCDRLDYAEITIRELKAKIAELEKRLNNVLIVPYTRPVTVPSVWPSNSYGTCIFCGQNYFSGIGHICPNTIKVTCATTTSTTKAKPDDNKG